MKEHAERNNIWERSQLGTCSGVMETVDQLIMPQLIGKARLDDKSGVGVPENVVNGIVKLIEGWKIRLE